MTEVEFSKLFERKRKKIIKKVSKICSERDIILTTGVDFKNDIILEFRKTKYNKISKVSYPYMDYTECHVLFSDIMKRSVFFIMRDIKGFIKMTGMW